MNRNSYVTAALFVVFALLTAFYWAMDEDQADSTVLQTTAPEGINVEVNGVDALVDGGQESSSIEQLRLTLAAERSRKVDELKEVVASSDYDAMAKSEAKDSITKISKEFEHAQVLESMIKAKGYTDVLV
ncbi:MAG: SpoIIIAH-like family protein, partial [Turicibacter sp.]